MKIYYKKGVVLAMISLFMAGCAVDPYEDGLDGPYFDWMPNDLLWQHNIRECRSQPQCNAADLFQRT